MLGDHVEQKGSIVQPDKLRFDFSNGGPVDAQQLKRIEELVQFTITMKLPVRGRGMGGNRLAAAGVGRI